MNYREINIAFGFDENFWTHAAVTIVSLLETAEKQTKYNIYCIISNSFNIQMQNILGSIFNAYPSFFSIKFIKVENKLDKIKSAKKATYYRLLLPQILPNVDKIIYTDTDLIFNSDMQDLYFTDLDNYYIAAAKDFYKGNNCYPLWQKYGILLIAKKEQYFNAGVLLLNLKNIRAAKIDEKWIKLAEEESFPFHDQDILNLTCQEKIFFLSKEYNFFHDNAKIIHFSGQGKPWTYYEYNWKFTELWWFYAHKTPFVPFFLANYCKSNSDSLRKILPKWLGRIMCWFIFDKEDRHRFFNTYVKDL